MDSILIRDLRVDAKIGIHERERHVHQVLSIDLDIGLESKRVFLTGQVRDTIDYEQVAIQIEQLACSRHFDLVETLADEIARLLVAPFGAPWAKVTVSKVGVLNNAQYVGVSVLRQASIAATNSCSEMPLAMSA